MKHNMRTLLLSSILGLGLSSHAAAHDDGGKKEADYSHRSEANQNRDEFRQPFRTLDFFGVKPDDKVVEILPGGGWYTEILAPMLAYKGELVAAHYPKTTPSEYRQRSRKNYETKLSDNASVYGNVVVADFNPNALVDPKTTDADVVLTFRGLHGLQNSGDLAAAFSQFNQMLKKGGALGVVQHQAPEGYDPIQSARMGYLPKSHVISVAKAAGFDLVAEAYFHNNPKDDILQNQVEGGVWNLPPSLRTDFKEKYQDVGESNRMTLLFQKR